MVAHPTGPWTSTSRRRKGDAANPQVFSRPFFPPKEHSVMTVDGKHGPITQAWIEKWQVHLHNIGRPIRRDGLVDRCQGGRDVSTKTNTVYSLMMMNVAFGQVTGEGWLGYVVESSSRTLGPLQLQQRF